MARISKHGPKLSDAERQKALLDIHFDDPDDAEIGDAIETPEMDWRLEREKWANVLTCREVARKFVLELDFHFKELIADFSSDTGFSVGSFIAQKIAKVKRELNRYCGGTLKPPVCPNCQNVGPPITEDKFDTARMEFLFFHATQLTRAKGGEWTIRVEGSDYTGRSPQEAIDAAAKAVDETLRPSGPVRFKAYVRRFRR
jgi:hypothetical protein